MARAVVGMRRVCADEGRCMSAGRIIRRLRFFAAAEEFAARYGFFELIEEGFALSGLRFRFRLGRR